MANYSTDNNLKVYEPNILDHLPNTTPTTEDFDDQHAESKRIIDEILIKRLPENVREQIKTGNKTMNNVVDEADLQTVSVYHTLFLVFNGLSSKEEDIFDIKSQKYRELFQEKLSELAVDISTDDDDTDFEQETTLDGIKLFRT